MEESQLGDSDEVIVVGGANSAGQAAVFLARTGRRVHVLVRSDSLSVSMSRYLVRRIEETPTIEVRTRTEIAALEGNGHLERVLWRDIAGGIRSQYTIGYKPATPKTQGGYRQVKVEAHSHGYGKLTVRTKSGYYAGPEPASGAQ